MKYVSTRNSKLTVPGSTAVLTGLAPDGGLYVPESFPYFSEEKIRAMEEMDYPERSATVMSAFFDELSYDELLDIARRAYATFDGDPAPLVKLDGETKVQAVAGDSIDDAVFRKVDAPNPDYKLTKKKSTSANWV